MKNILMISGTLLLFASLFAFSFNPKHEETTSFKVYGNCGMCKTRIEAALKGVEGVRSAVWNMETKMITVTFNPHVLQLKDIHQKIAAAGHDTDQVKADEDAYKKLPKCCKYKRAAK
jgi:periplasmic mercuric ion binding protein